MVARGGDDMGRWSPADPKSNSVTTGVVTVCLCEALRATDANMEMRLLIASVACKLLIYGHLRVTLGLPGKSIAQSAKRLDTARCSIGSLKSSLISRVPGHLNYAWIVIYVFGLFAWRLARV
jgi:hypothetical protein